MMYTCSGAPKSPKIDNFGKKPVVSGYPIDANTQHQQLSTVVAPQERVGKGGCGLMGKGRKKALP